MSLVNIGKESITSFNTGSGTASTTPQPLGPATPVHKYVVIRVARANSGSVMIGPTLDSAADGFLMENGRVSPPIYVDDVSKIFIVGSAPNQIYSWIAF